MASSAKTFTKLTPKKKRDFLAALAACGNVSRAADAVAFERVRFYQERKRDTEFKDAWDDALDIGADALEDEAIRRAFDGWDEPVYQQGKLVGVVRKYSDTLLIFLLKGAKPGKYRDNVKIEHSGGMTLDSTQCENKARAAAQQRLAELRAKQNNEA